MRRLALLIPVLLAAQQTIRVQVDLVYVPVLVLSREGRIIPNLPSTAFHVFEDDRPRDFALDTGTMPASVAIVLQATPEVGAYLPFIARSGNALDALLIGESGESGLLVYGDRVTVRKPFGRGELALSLAGIAPDGPRLRAMDAGMQAIRLLRSRPPGRARVLLYVGQPADHRSESTLDDLRREAETENVTVHAITLPEIGREFVSDTFTLEGLSSREDRGGFKAGVDLARLVPTFARVTSSASSSDPFSQLAAATGGTQLHVRTQRQFEEALAILGVQLHSAYALTFPANPAPGYHTLRVEIDPPGAKTHARPGYWTAAH
jgi:VWFA-related protein